MEQIVFVQLVERRIGNERNPERPGAMSFHRNGWAGSSDAGIDRPDRVFQLYIVYPDLSIR
jgi:hypothetical protein